MESNAESILLRYRALNQKAAELRNMVTLPIKRDHRTFAATTTIEGLSSKQVSDVMQLLLAYISSCP
jgi:hypothetical protein